MPGTCSNLNSKAATGSDHRARAQQPEPGKQSPRRQARAGRARLTAVMLTVTVTATITVPVPLTATLCQRHWHAGPASHRPGMAGTAGGPDSQLRNVHTGRRHGWTQRHQLGPSRRCLTSLLVLLKV